MARSGSNPMQQHHKKQKQKQVQKNKQQRSKARDERVVKEKSADSVKEEIFALEKRGKRHKLQPAEEQKLQRLKKELKLVQDAAEAAKAAQAEQPHYQQQQQPLTELDDPRKSVYYDAQFNPYGAPPPGKPRLYHQRGGGVTMDIRMAVVPGEEPPPPPPPPPPPQKDRPQRHHQSALSSSLSLHPVKPSSTTTKKNRPHDTPGESKVKKWESMERNAGITVSKTEKSVESMENDAAPNAASPSKPMAIPSLPPASQAVQRIQRRRKQAGMADIWASNEEVEYERHVNNIDVEADVLGSTLKTKKKKAKKKKVPLEYFYKDQAGQVQGPFGKSQMVGWIQAGYFPLDKTLVKTTRKDEWIPIGEVSSLQEPPQQPEKSSIEDRIAALKKGNATENGEEAESLSVQAKIAALKGTPSSKETGVAPYPAPPDDQADEASDEYAAASYPTDDNNEAREDDAVDEHPSAPYPLGEDDHVDFAYPVFAPYPTGDGNDDDMAVAAYPTTYEEEEEDGAVPAYPADATHPTGDDLAYPVTDAYPSGEDIDYGATDEYPLPAVGVATEEEEARLTKKTVKVDSSLVALLPSHLQTKKRKLKEPSDVSRESLTKKPRRNPGTASAKKSGGEDELDKFMDEIDELE